MVNYNNGKIYKIVADNGDEGDVYIGSTTKQRLCDRMCEHRCHFKRWKEGKQERITSCDIFGKYGIENCNIVLLELVNCNSKDELTARERFWIESTICVNKQIPTRTKKEYYETNKEKINEQRIVQCKYYREMNKEIIKQCRDENKETKKEYDIQRSFKLLNCECGSICSYAHKSNHFKTQKHQDYLKQK